LAVDGLTIQGGKNLPGAPGMPPCQGLLPTSTLSGGLGGGICAEVSAGGSLGVALSRLILWGNRARVGGGVMARASDTGTTLTLTVTDSTVTRNAALWGGGIAIIPDAGPGSPTVNVTLDGVVFRRNRATTADATIASALGGGLFIVGYP